MKKTFLYFGLILVIYVFLYYFNLKHILTSENISIIYEDIINGDEDVAKKLYDSVHEYSSISCFIMILSTIIKIIFYALVVYLGYYIIEKQSFKTVFQAIVGAEFINIIMATVKNINLVFFNPPTSVISMSAIPFSLLSFFNESKLDQWMTVPLSALNLFELFYIVTLSFLLSKKTDEPWGKSCKTVLLSYGLVMILYVVCATIIALYATK